MIHFKAIRWKNVLSTGNQFTEIQLDKSQTTLIVGQNGAGKSTILDALTFALFGKTFRNINKPQLVNSITRKDALIEVEFSIQDKQYMIRRGMKPNVFEVFCNGKLLNQSADMRDYQEVLEKNILKINYKSFCQVVILGSASFVPFMQLPAGQRRAIIEDLLDLQVFTVMNNLLKDKVKENEDSIGAVSSEQRLIREKIKMLKEHLIELQSKNEQFIEDKQKELDGIQEKIDASILLKEQISSQIKEKSKLLVNSDSVQNKIEQLRSIRVQLETKNKSLSKEIEFFSNHDNCPTCKQEISSEFSCETIKQREGQIKEIEDGLDKLAETYQRTKDELDKILEIDRECDDLRSKASNETLKIQMNNDRVRSIMKEIEEARKSAADMSDDKVADLETELTSLNNKYNDLQDDKSVLAAAAALLKDGGIKTKIINQYVPIINKLINKYLSAMDFFVDFQLNSQFEETIKSRYRDEFSYASFSEGEKMRINLALLFAWRAVAKMRNSASTNLLIMDEVFDSSLDANGTEEFMKILTGLIGDTNTFIISHKTEQLSDKFDNVIRFEKHRNFSRIAGASE